MEDLPIIRLEDICRIASEFQLFTVAYSPIEKLADSHQHRLQVWQKSGKSSDLEYMKREASLYVDPTAFGVSMGTVISFACFYSRSPLAPRPMNHARVARYAWGRDYHRVLKKRIVALSERLATHYQLTQPFRAFTDSVPLLERAMAERAGLGFIGKNSMLIRYREGSFSLLGELLIPARVFQKHSEANNLVGSTSGNDASTNCGSCRRCQDACPTGALDEAYSVDARLCISALTIERRGMLTRPERLSLGEWIFGCDICQDVCPFNYRALKLQSVSQIPELSEESGCGAYLDLKEILAIRKDEDYLARFAGTPLMRAKREGLIRNGICVAVNMKYEELVPYIRDCLFEDCSSVVKATALWGLRQFETPNIILDKKLLNDPLVQAEQQVLS